MTSSKSEILSAIRRNRPSAAELPELVHDWTTYPDRRAQFIEILKFVGGSAIVGSNFNAVGEQLRQLPIFTATARIASLVPNVCVPNVDLAALATPHALDDIDIAVLPGEFAVAENGAIWVTDRDIRHRVLYFLCQHLVLVVPADQIIDHMHAAYERLAGAGQNGSSIFSTPQFGVFISGPSKTADIEQSLVIGAHGARSLTVCLVSK